MTYTVIFKDGTRVTTDNKYDLASLCKGKHIVEWQQQQGKHITRWKRIKGENNV